MWSTMWTNYDVYGAVVHIHRTRNLFVKRLRWYSLRVRMCTLARARERTRAVYSRFKQVTREWNLATDRRPCEKRYSCRIHHISRRDDNVLREEKISFSLSRSPLCLADKQKPDSERARVYTRFAFASRRIYGGEMMEQSVFHARVKAYNGFFSFRHDCDHLGSRNCDQCNFSCVTCTRLDVKIRSACKSSARVTRVCPRVAIPRNCVLIKC